MADQPTQLVTKRIYDEPSDDDGCRVLVDRLWPRGVSKESAGLDLWLKEIAPSPPLRTEFAHMQERFADFRKAYLAELEQNPAVDTLLDLAGKHSRVTLLYAARDADVNHARVLLEFLAPLLKRSRRGRKEH
ncbi:DUF488 domain-containing protein [Arthrobacter cupressi]|uniref:Uncharacterized conserved protein YeaO, DUF488 family n=1 Tax=Arthrobacter cupressi TaxID=1045773 RepID=A0A1G8XZM5_9MICC|nr:DUF488 family protein [Arthrobacter cupressi]NYD76381.1 uncharacterized protein YeaO (DUF488 family) [Arthrobacter cupressi]SDJ95240.1 Uncharacterized conserved protein YeaO, DUF488 family [Arthrobacter cupressi]